MDILILFGKQLFTDGKLDWIAESRCDLALTLLIQNPSLKLIISGGKTSEMTSEAQAMKDYILSKQDLNDRITLEESGVSTIHQLIVLKREYLTTNKWFNVGLISDEYHIKRIEFIATHLLGDKFNIKSFGSVVRLSGHNRILVSEFEKNLLELSKNNPVVLHFSSGDDATWELYDNYYREKKKELNSDKLDINEEFLKFLNNNLHI